MRAWTLVVTSVILIMIGIGVSLIASESSYFSTISYGFGKCAIPPPNWESQYWAVLSHGSPTAEVIVNGSHTINLNEIKDFPLNSTSFYVYVVSGYVESLAPLSLAGILLVFMGTAMGFRGMVLLVQERTIGNLANSEGEGSIKSYVMKRLLSFIISMIIITSITGFLEIAHGESILKVIIELITLNFGLSRRYDIAVDSLLLSSLPYTSVLSGISFALSVYLGTFLAVRGIAQSGPLTKLITKWKYIGNALASWIIALSLIYGFHLDVEKGVNLIFPLISLFFPFIGTFANRLFLPYKVQDSFKAKGLSRAILVYRHVLGSTSVVALSTISAAFIDMLIAEFLVESIFYWPGLGLSLERELCMEISR